MPQAALPITLYVPLLPRFSKRWVLIGILLFAALEASLILWCDRSLSQSLRVFDHTTPWLFAFFRAITNAGWGLWYLWPSGLGALACGIAWKTTRRAELRTNAQWLGVRLLAFFIGVGASGIVNNIIKFFVGRSRPKLFDQNQIYAMQHFIYKADWNSFPSGHTTNIFAAAYAFSLLYPRARIPAFAFASLIGLSRVMITAHYLSDVLAGALVGLGVVWGLAQLLQRYQKSQI